MNRLSIVEAEILLNNLKYIHQFNNTIKYQIDQCVQSTI